MRERKRTAGLAHAPRRCTISEQPPRRSFFDRMSLRAEPYFYAAPALSLIVTIMLVPLALGLSYAFRDVQLLNPLSGGFVGLEHFRVLAYCG